MLELMVPVSACWAEVYKERSKREHLEERKGKREPEAREKNTNRDGEKTV